MRIEINNQNAALQNTERIVSGSVNICTVAFGFDATWDQYAKVAVFEWKGKDKTIDAKRACAGCRVWT